MATANCNGFGEWLRQARESSGITLETITRQTRIPIRHLEALEHGVLGLPDFYQRAEVRAFARAVGVDEQVALARLTMAVTHPEEPAVEMPRPAPPPRPERTGVALAGAALAVAAVLAVAWFAARPTPASGNLAPPLTTTSAQPPAAVAPDASDTATTPLAEAADPSASPAAGATPAASELTELVVTTQPAGARVTVNGIGWGVSPVTIRYLPPGDKRIRVVKDGYSAAERVVARSAGGRQEVTIALSAP